MRDKIEELYDTSDTGIAMVGQFEKCGLSVNPDKLREVWVDCAVANLSAQEVDKCLQMYQDMPFLRLFDRKILNGSATMSERIANEKKLKAYWPGFMNMRTKFGKALEEALVENFVEIVV